MHILFACDIAAPERGNPFLNQLIDALNQNKHVSSIQYGVSQFWKKSLDVNVLHIQWPEALFNWREPSDIELSDLESQLRFWKKNTTIVATIHNRFPHYKSSKRFQKLYSLVYSYCNGIIHLGDTSLKDFKEKYTSLKAIIHTIVPLGDYTCFKNEVSSVEARKFLKIDPGVFVCLSFCKLRNFEETHLLLKGFEHFKCRSKIMIVVGKYAWPSSRSFRYYQKIKLSLKSNIIHQSDYVPYHQVQYYMNAANVLVIPRIKILNSSNVSLGFTFGKVVVGPKTGVVGELLEKTGNPTFSPATPEFLAKAIEEGIKLAQKNKGLENKKFANKYWNWETIATQHTDFYMKVTQKNL